MRIWKVLSSRHSGSVALAAAAVASGVAWYLGDAGVTGMPPEWLILLLGCGAAALLNHFRDEDTQPDE